jgi:AbrB family looped-hinge helix DNA binding protein
VTGKIQLAIGHTTLASCSRSIIAKVRRVMVKQGIAKDEILEKEARITSKGQITVPREVRRVLGVRPGDRLLFESGEKGVRVRPVRAQSQFAKFKGIGNPGIGSGRKGTIAAWAMTTAIDTDVIVTSGIGTQGLSPQIAYQLGNGRESRENRSSKSEHADLDCTGKPTAEKTETGPSNIFLARRSNRPESLTLRGLCRADGISADHREFRESGKNRHQIVPHWEFQIYDSFHD